MCESPRGESDGRRARGLSDAVARTEFILCSLLKLHIKYSSELGARGEAESKGASRALGGIVAENIGPLAIYSENTLKAGTYENRALLKRRCENRALLNRLGGRAVSMHTYRKAL